MKSLVQRIINGDRSNQTVTAVFGQMMDGSLDNDSIKELLLGFEDTGYSGKEVAFLAGVLLARCKKVRVSDDAIDMCGTGGGGIHTFNISTASAFIVAACDVPVAKHGNRAVTSKCGSADVLQALGAKIELGPQEVSKCIYEVGIGFMFAPLYHTAMKHVMPARKALGKRTIFNLVGPLANPAFCKRQLIGVSDAKAGELISQAAMVLDKEYVWAVYSGGTDELLPGYVAKVWEVKQKACSCFDLDTQSLGFSKVDINELGCGDTTRKSAQCLIAAVKGKGPASHVKSCILNAAAALCVTQEIQDIKDGLARAEDMVYSGKALARLREFIAYTSRRALKDIQL